MTQLLRRTQPIPAARLSWLEDTLRLQGLAANAASNIWKD